MNAMTFGLERFIMILLTAYADFCSEVSEMEANIFGVKYSGAHVDKQKQKSLGDNLRCQLERDIDICLLAKKF